MSSTQDHESYADDGQHPREHAGPETDLVRDTDPDHHAYDASTDPTRELGAERDLVAGGEPAPVHGGEPDHTWGAERDLVAHEHDHGQADPDRQIGAERDLVADDDRTAERGHDVDR